MTQITWILIANSSTAKLYESTRVGYEQTLIQSFEHPESREKTGDLITDRGGHYETQSGKGGGDYQEPTPPKRYEQQVFAKELADTLEAGRTHNQYDNLIIAASPYFLGLLNQQCHEQVLGKVWHSIEKDYTKLDENTLLTYLQQLVKPF